MEDKTKRKEFIYEGSNSFLGEVIAYSDAKYVIIPVPIEMTTSFLRGTRFGPREVINASISLENYDHETDREVKDEIYTLNELELPPDMEKSIECIKDTVSDVLQDDKIPILIGGEHTMTYGASLAFDKDTIFLVFDAHADFKKDMLGVEINHASTCRLISQNREVIIFGVRSLNMNELEEIKKRKIFITYIEEANSKAKINNILKRIRGRKVYISVDMDVFDPSIAPGVGTPQPGGMT
ncbi:MAG: arginase family protein, partial [Candidatus Acidifodinimicrobium sp.]